MISSGLKVIMWTIRGNCTYNFYDLIMMDGRINDETLSLVKSKLGIESEITFTDNTNQINYLMMECTCTDSYPVINEIIQKFFGIITTPVKYEGGWEFHRFVCISKKHLKQILSNLEAGFQIKIISIKEDEFFGPLSFYGLSPHQFLDSLTNPQISLLQDAFQEGYYKIPRKVKLADIAGKLGISRYAVESRLRRGENSIMKLVLPLIDFQMSRTTSPK